MNEASSHSEPPPQGKYALFPGKWAGKVLFSDVGVVATLAGLAFWAHAAGSVWPVVALYWGPYMFVNFWLVLYTWLQHTDVDVPHYGCGRRGVSHLDARAGVRMQGE